MVLVVLAIAVPLAWVVLTSFKERGDIYVQPAIWWPRVFAASNYSDATTSVPFWRFLTNSLIVTGALAVIKFVLGIASAYGLVFLHFPFKRLIFVVVIAALMVPNQITVIVNYSLVAQLGYRNTLLGIIVPLAGVAFGTFLMRTAFLGLPNELEEAARIDGANPWQIFWRVMVPLVRSNI
ncbi:carbohydrate ABC transporter permease, partial [Jatrophihabitans endophyticus]|uniref:carbohydrate ABC transporter permease n=1 Tax=Jatrophihabitans endophyticus TaxID=1206085 RepID=UPI0019FBA922|nr:carbohydrate ABC transporter permease [Jatrophihabitans endophyticus]